jgi:hypothetical protein
MNISHYTQWIRQVFQDICQYHKIKSPQARWKIRSDIKFNCSETASNASCNIRRVGIYAYTFPTAQT